MSQSADLTQIRIQLMLGQPFLASAIAAFRLVVVDEVPWCPTMATDGVIVCVNRGWAQTQSRPHLEFVLAHEVMHCVLGHIDRRSYRDAFVWNVAVDYATNLFLVEAGLTCPPSGLFDRRFRGLTSEEIYEELWAHGQGTVGLARFGGSSSAVEIGKLGVDGPAWATQPGFDAHLEPGDFRLLGVRGTDVPTPEERRRLRQSVWLGMKPKVQGLLRGLLQSEVEAATRSRVNWQALLARFITGLRRSDFRMFPFNRKHLWRGFYLPSIGAPGPDWLVAAMDTSGSMEDDDLAAILTELDNLRANGECTLSVLQCDAAIQKVEEFAAHEVASWERGGGRPHYSFQGRGGTDFRPVFEWVWKESNRRGGRFPDALIYMTDGFGIFPAKAPPWPVMWILSMHSAPEIPFGWSIRTQLSTSQRA